MRDSPSLDIIPSLIKEKFTLKVFDPEGMDEAKKYFSKYKEKIFWCKDSYEASNNSEALVILTEWYQFKNMDLKKISNIMIKPIIIDFRNLFSLDSFKKLNIEYHSIGIETINSHKEVE